jgi:hypothetical protein
MAKANAGMNNIRFGCMGKSSEAARGAIGVI